MSAVRERVDMWAPPEGSLDFAGAYEVSERLVPGFESGDPDVFLYIAARSLSWAWSLICWPRRKSGSALAIYHIRGGGMVVGNNLNGVVEFLSYAHELGCVLISVEHRLVPQNPYTAALHDCLAGLSGSWITPTTSMPTHLGSSSPATALERVLLRRPPWSLETRNPSNCPVSSSGSHAR